MTKTSAMLGGCTRTCMLVLMFAFLVCEIVLGQMCRSLLITVDSFHTLYISINVAISSSKNRPKASLNNPQISSTSLSKPHKSGIFTTSSPSVDQESLECPGTVQQPYTRMRLQPFCILISALLMASQCVSVSLEILTRLVRPEAIQHPFLSIVIGATSVLFNTLMFTLRMRNRGRNEANDGIEFPGLMHTDLHSTSEKKDVAVQDDALMFCNPEAPSVLNPDGSSQDCSSTCYDLQNHHLSKPVPELGHAQISNSKEGLKTTEEVSQEPGNSAYTEPAVTSHDQDVVRTSKCTSVRSGFRRLQSGRMRHLITVIQDLLCSALILVNGLVVLLIKPHCHRPHSDCHLLVYLDASFSTLVVLVLLATAVPKLCRYGLLVLQATPLHLRISELRDSLTRVPGVLTVHELHVWQLSDTYVVASVHVHCTERLNAEECSDLMVKITRVLSNFGVNHCTVQPEFLPSDRSDTEISGGDDRKGCSLRCGRECAEKLCCSSEVDKSSFLQPDRSTASQDLRSVCPQKEGFSPPIPVSPTKDVIIENTRL